jgi:predicted nucleic acid-binding protein
MSEQAIVDTSALIALEKINTVHVLCRIYSSIVLPEAVISEFGPPPIDCYSIEKVKSPMVRLFIRDLNLGRGEAESIALASEMGLTLVLDDLKARKIAETLDLRITGTIGVLLKAENMTFIKSAYDKTIEHRDKGFYVSDKLLEEVSRFKASDTNSNP